MKFRSDANILIEDDLKETTTSALWSGLITAVNNKYATQFTQAMQAFLPRIALSISDVSLGPHLKTHTYLGALDYLCHTVVNNKTLYNMLKACGVNDEGNTIKHQKKNISIDIPECINQYNKLMSALESAGLTVFKKYHLRTEAVRYRDRPVFSEHYDLKYDIVAGIKHTVKLDKNSIKKDPYSKTVSADVIVEWKDEHDYYCAFDVLMDNGSGGDEEVSDLVKIANSDFVYMSDHTLLTHTISVPAEKLNRRALKVYVKVRIFSKYQEGHLFWKKDSFREIGNKCSVVSVII